VYTPGRRPGSRRPRLHTKKADYGALAALAFVRTFGGVRPAVLIGEKGT
jgi:hypothetical protein